MLTVRQAFETFYLPHRPILSLKTIARYRDEITRWERHTTNPTIDLITTQTFVHYRAACLASGLRPTSIEGGIRTVLQVLRLCGPEQERREGLGLIAKVPYVGRPLPQTGILKSTPSVDELRLMWQVCGCLGWPPNCNTETFWRAWIGVGYVTGLRLSDMLGLRASMLHGDVLTITAHKTGTSHVFPLPPWLLSVLHQLPPGEKLFPCKRLPCFIRRELAKLSKKIGIGLVTPHGLRRASITQWSMLHHDCGRLIHGEGLRIRDHYVDRLALLRRWVNFLPSLEIMDDRPATTTQTIRASA